MLKNNHPFIDILKENTYKKKSQMQNNNIHHYCYFYFNFIQNQLLKQIWAPNHISPNLLNIINSILIVYNHPCAVILIQTLHQNPRSSYEGNGKKVQVSDSSNKSNIMKFQLHKKLIWTFYKTAKQQMQTVPSLPLVGWRQTQPRHHLLFRGFL